MLLFQWGSYDWNDGSFSYDITRQFILDGADDDDAIWQLSLTVLFEATDDTAAAGSGNCWCHTPEELSDFRSLIAACVATPVALSLQPIATRLTFESVG
jgi:hypothetical protein